MTLYVNIRQKCILWYTMGTEFWNTVTIYNYVLLNGADINVCLLVK